MALATTYSLAIIGVEAFEVTVEAHLSNGLPGFNIVGLPEATVKESKERVRSAILNSMLEFPARRITVNLAPADLPKAGGRYDLAIALSILAASGQLPCDALKHYYILGELALNGDLRGVQGVLPAVLAALKINKAIILAQVNNAEMSLALYDQAKTANTLLEVLAYFIKGSELSGYEVPSKVDKLNGAVVKLSDIKGQVLAKRVLQIAACGNHNLLMLGPPGTGKTMLANCLVGLLPELSVDDALQLAAIKSIALISQVDRDWREPPMRAPHHTASNVALVGGGSRLSPGEVSLAHKGVLFLDEIAEFSPKVLEVLREPIESGYITLSRANYRVRLPANFQLVAAMNPCPCGYAGDTINQCSCSAERVSRYLARISGPIIDRIDLLVELPRLSHSELISVIHTRDNTDNEKLKAAIEACRQGQLDRSGKLNSELNSEEVERYCSISSKNRNMLASITEALGLSARAFHRILKVARTIADYQGHRQITQANLQEAISYRRSDKLIQSRR
ncbi:MAG: ATP-dependent protease [SAR86 cluster bacterium]|uniref:ATP-dependent protease n=1 Tax=SAR86 cluster bacterium TaxID=2030880 RepID=A0A2A4MSH6_9GAMM|nr:MAG: ATP-dependent protease [SAR86 cluster bacterium]